MKNHRIIKEKIRMVSGDKYIRIGNTSQNYIFVRGNHFFPWWPVYSYTLKTKRLFLTEKQLIQYQRLVTVIFNRFFQLKITVIKTVIEHKRLFLPEKNA